MDDEERAVGGTTRNRNKEPGVGVGVGEGVASADDLVEICAEFCAESNVLVLVQ